MEYSDFIGLAGIPIITGLIQIVKGFNVPDKGLPVVALILGMVLNIVIAVSVGNEILLAVLMGIVTGLAASGLYSQTKTIAKG